MRIAPVHRFAVSVSALGVAVLVAYGVTGEYAIFAAPPATLLVLAALTIVAEHVHVKLPLQRDDISMSPSQLFAFAVLLMYGPGAGVATWAVAAFVSEVLRRRSVLKTAFNTAQFALSAAAAGEILVALGPFPFGRPDEVTAADLPALVLAALALWVLNQALPTVASSLAMGVSLRDWLSWDTKVLFVTDAVLLAFSPIVFVVADSSPLLLPLLALPFVALFLSTREAERRQYEGLHDPLTSLPNRAFFVRRVERALREAGEEGPRPVTLLLDVDRFKEINDSLGHAAGDVLLRHVGERVTAAAPAGSFVARLGGDEFAVLLEGAGHDPEAIAANIRGALEEPTLVAGVNVSPAASVGLARDERDGVDALVRRADVAMYVAKSETGIAWYDPSKDSNRPERLERLAQLRVGIPRGELTVHFQPKISLRTGEVAGAEALVRWQHPTLGLLAPVEFIELAETTDLSGPLTMAVLEAALDQAAEWQRTGMPVPVAVNLPPQVIVDRGLTPAIAKLLAARGLDGGMLKLEITERMLMRDTARASALLTELADLGVRVSIDDFGTGYSSLVLLQRLPVHEIKVDRSFVRDLPGNANDAAIVQSIVGLGRTLGVEVVAEGVETEEAMRHLAALGCHTAQGYYISKPLPAADFSAWLAREAAATRVTIAA